MHVYVHADIRQESVIALVSLGASKRYRFSPYGAGAAMTKPALGPDAGVKSAEQPKKETLPGDEPTA